MKELSPVQMRNIDRALVIHRIRIDDDAFSTLCDRVEFALHLYAIKQTFTKPQSKAAATADIERLQYALSVIEHSGSARRIIQDATASTKTGELAEQFGLIDEITARMNKAFDPTDLPPRNSLFDLAFAALSEACAVALRGGDLAPHVAPSGRPVDDAKQELVKNLASAFTRATGHKATDTEAGAFDDFLTACQAVVEPAKAAGTSNRKLIRKALKHVPKPTE